MEYRHPLLQEKGKCENPNSQCQHHGQLPRNPGGLLDGFPGVLSTILPQRGSTPWSPLSTQLCLIHFKQNQITPYHCSCVEIIMLNCWSSFKSILFTEISVYCRSYITPPAHTKVTSHFQKTVTSILCTAQVACLLLPQKICDSCQGHGMTSVFHSFQNGHLCISHAFAVEQITINL